MCDEQIEYRYLNLDERVFYPSYQKLLQSCEPGWLIRCFSTTPEINQMLYVVSRDSISRSYAIRTCRELSNDEK